MQAARITAIATAFPTTVLEQDHVADLLPDWHDNRDVLRKILRGSGITRRRFAIDPEVEDVSRWTTSARMSRFQQEGLPLATQAATQALNRAGVGPGEVGEVCVVSSTGYKSPGIDSRLLRDLGMAPTTRRLAVGHMGCFAALPGLAACVDFAQSHTQAALLVNVELSSLHLQPPPWDVEQLVINSLFGDGVVAMVVQGEGSSRGHGADVLDVASYTDWGNEEHMNWEVGDYGFLMGLSPAIPDLIGQRLPGLVRELLDPHAMAVDDVRWWAIHPGGRRVIDAAEDSLGLSAEVTAPSRAVLSEYGNCSSSGLPIVMARMQRDEPLRRGQPGVAMTFGPGLTLCVALLRGA